MRAVILSARAGGHTTELLRALAERGHSGDVLPYEGLVASVGTTPQLACVEAFEVGPRRESGPSQSETTSATAPTEASPGVSQSRLLSEQTSILDADVVLPRIIPGGSLEQIIYRVDALHWIEDRGVLVVNSPRAIERCVDKFYTTTLLHDAGLPTPETVICERVDDAVAAVAAMGDVVIKPIFGSLGHGMIRVREPELARRVLRPLDQVRSVFYVQRTIDHGGRDVRAFVIGGRVLGAIERRAPDGEWRTNVAIGGTARAIDLTPEMEQMALRAAAVVGADYAGVDLLPSREGSIFVLEVNGIPGWQGLQEATGLDVAAAIVAHIERRVQSRHASSMRPEEPLPV